MTSRTETSPDHGVVASDRPGVQANNSSRWRLNSSGQLVDADPAWDLSEDLNKLKLGDEKELRAQIRTPPKPRGVASALARFNDASPVNTPPSATSNSPSPHIFDRPAHKAHWRGSSTSTSSSQDSNVSTTGHAMVGHHHANLKITTNVDHKERPHSFSGGLSSADLRRLQQAGEAPNDSVHSPVQQWPANEQPSYPSLLNQGNRISPQIPVSPPRQQDMRGISVASRRGDDLQVDYASQQRNFNPLPQHQPAAMSSIPVSSNSAPPQSFNNRVNGTAGASYRQLPRGYSQQGPIPSPTSMGYPPNTHLPVNNSQQVYEMMLSHDGHHSAVARAQQQHNLFQNGHHHNPSDPAAMREAAAMALLSNNLQGFNPAMFQAPMGPTMPMYPNQFYGAQDLYTRPNVVSPHTLAAARLQQQYTGPYGIMSSQNGDVDTLSSPSSAGQGPSANNRKLGLYKTELCRSWEEKGACRYGAKCQFAHGEDELRSVQRHPKYKTEICRTFWVSGSCPYGKRCCFIHTELPQSGPPGAASVEPNQSHAEGHVRSSSTTSDPNDASISLLARISAKRETVNTNTGAPAPSEITPTSAYQMSSRPAALRVDTKTLDKVSISNQNKSAYPSFTSNGILLPASDQPTAKSPAPATAGPDLGRRNNFAYGGPQARHKSNSSGSSIRNSFNGEDLEFNYSPTSTQPGHGAYGITSPDGSIQTPRANGHGHSRTGSAGNWGNIGRSTNLTMSAYPRVGGETMPWATSELALGSTRLNEQTWA